MARKANTKSNSKSKKKEQAGREIDISELWTITYIVFLAVANIISLVCLLSDYCGKLGPVVRNLVLGLFGECGYILSLVVICSTLWYLIMRFGFKKERSEIKPYKCWLLVLAVVLVSILAHLLSAKLDAMLTLYENGINFAGGGMIGGSIADFLYKYIGVLTYVITISLLAVIAFVVLKGTVVAEAFMQFLLWIKEKFLKEDDEVFEEEIVKKKKEKKEKQKEEEEPSALSDVQATQDADSEVIESAIEEEAEKSLLPKKKKEKIETLEIEVEPDEEFEADYKYPSINILSPAEPQSADTEEELERTARKLIDTLDSFGVKASILDYSKGPTITRYELQPSAGVKISKITGLADDIALNLATVGIRIEPIAGKTAIGIEVPNEKQSMVKIREVIGSAEFAGSSNKLAFAVGKDIAGKPVIGDIARMPHLLIAGSTGSGKSVCINTLITSILYKAAPHEVKLVMVDPKVVELGIYNGIPHLLIPVVTEPRKAAGALQWAVVEMTNRYKLFAENNVRDIKGYNKLAEERGEKTLPQIVIIIDELADLMMVAPHEVEDAICRLAQMARAAGMHLVIATQRPSVDVITGIIKANVPSRIAFAVSSYVDSRTILDMGGAEKLLGKGDMLYYPMGMSKPLRVQGAFVSDKEVEEIVEFVKTQNETNYDQDVIEQIENAGERPVANDNSGKEADSLLPQAVEMAIKAGQASVAMYQRHLKVGYQRAARLIDQMEERGIIGPFDGTKPREVLITMAQWNEMTMNMDVSNAEPEQLEVDFDESDDFTEEDDV